MGCNSMILVGVGEKEFNGYYMIWLKYLTTNNRRPIVVNILI